WLAGQLLEREGHNCVPAASAEEALAAFRAGPFDAVLIQGQFGGAAGGEFCARGRLLEQGTERPAVILGLTAAASARERCLAAGMDDVLPRPFTHADLLAAVRRCTEVLDWQQMQEALGDEVLARMVGLLAQELPRGLAGVRAAVGQGDGPALYRA